MLQNFYGLTASQAALYFFPFAVGNLLGPLLLGPLFDTVGRRKMIGGCYALTGVVLAISAVPLPGRRAHRGHPHGLLVRVVLLRLRRASAGYLTVSEIFPLEVRGQAISYFFSIAQSSAPSARSSSAP